MSDIYTSTTMDGLTKEEQCKNAIRHFLMVHRDNRHIAYHMGLYSESYQLLTEALANLTDIPVDMVRRRYACGDQGPTISEMREALEGVQESIESIISETSRANVYLTARQIQDIGRALER